MTSITKRTASSANRKHLCWHLVLIAVALALVFSLLLCSTLNSAPKNNDSDYDSGGRSMLYLITNATHNRHPIITTTGLRSVNYNYHSAATTNNRRRRLELDPGAPPLECPQITNRPPPQHPPLPTLQKSTYAVSFPGSGDRMITKYLVESVTGLFVGEAAVSPSLAKMKALEKKGAELIEGGMGKGQGEVVAVRTQFPHTSGKLASWDDDIPRAFVILRSPLHAIPCYFDQLYEMNSHLPAGSAKLPERSKVMQAAWFKWRDSQLQFQTMLFRRFVSFWMEKYLGNEGDRIFFAYEDFVDDEKGPGEAVRLAEFMGEGMKASAMEWSMSSMEKNPEEEGPQPFDAFLEEGLSPEQSIDKAVGEATKTMVHSEDVPCLWKDIVHSTVVSASSPVESGGRTRLLNQEEESNNYSFDGGEWIPAERPYTPENLAALSQMILELMNRWSRHQRLLSILSKYHREVNRAYLESIGKLEEALEKRDELDKVRESNLPVEQPKNNNNNISNKSNPQGHEEPQQPSKLPFHIIQASPQNTASIVVANWLIGLFEPEKDIAFMHNWPEQPIRLSGHDATIDSTIVTKTLNLDLLTMYKQLRPHFEEVFFVTSNRGTDPKTRLSDELCDFKNVLCIEYEELLYTNKDELHAMVRALTEKFRKRYEYYFGTNSDWLAVENELNAVERLEAMAMVSADMANMPNNEVDMKFGVNGKYQSGASVVGDNDADRRHRRLSIALPDGGCEITWPMPPKHKIQTSYAASYPGCGARMSWNLIEALTGLWTGDDWDNNGRGKRVVTVKTHYPHDAGKLVPWDAEINRALVIIRNPLNAIPSFFNHIYEIKNNLPIHSQRAPVSDWIEWRDRLAMDQIRKYAKFVDYWMERYNKLNDDRIFISYETLTDDNDGPEETLRIRNFLAQSEGVEPIETESVPCVWRAVVKYKKEVTDPQKRSLEDGRRRLDPLHHDSQRSGPTERPYTPELLEAMSKMLLDLIERWGDRHLRLSKTLEGYQQSVHAAYLAASNQSPAANTPQPPARNFHIIQASLPHTGSTVLNNLLVGLFDPEAEYKKSNLVTKTQDFDLLGLYKKERPKYEEIFFVASNRGSDPSSRVANELCEYNNVMCIEYEELQYSNRGEMEVMVKTLSNKISSKFEYFFGPGLFDESKQINAVKRLVAMDNAIASINDVGSEGAVRFEVNGKSFHIFQASPPHTASAVVTNWLMGLFEPEKDYSFMLNDGEQTVRNHDISVGIDTTVVTKTHIADLMMLYKQYRQTFDEIFFVCSNRGTDPQTRIDPSFCEFDNVFCIEYEELLFSNKEEMERAVNNLTNKFQSRFEYFFGANSNFLGQDNVASAVRRLEGMAQVAAGLANQPYSVSDPKYGVHGGIHNEDDTVIGGKHFGSIKGKLFYCGGAQRLRGQATFKYSTFGLVLTKSLFPDYEGEIEFQSGNKLATSATPLTEDTLKDSTENDLLIVNSHQHCEVPVADFPGRQLHVNAEYYDIHPKHFDNINGELTLNYLPPGQMSYVLGLHEDTSKSIRVPYCSMRLWYLHMSKQTTLNKIFDPLHRPKNTRDNFLLYINSHYIEYRERAARALSKVGTIHTAGKCQGYFEANPAPPDDNSAVQCVPFDDSQRPGSIQPISGELGLDHQHNNMDLFSHYRYALVMENTDVPGYVSEKILHAFLSGTIPIYYGSRFVFEIFNSRAFIYFDLDMPHQALSQVQFYEQNPAEYEKMLNEPILASGQETIEKYFSWDETVGNGKLKSRIRDMMGLG